MKWKTTVFLNLLLCTVTLTHAQLQKPITIEEILKQQKESRQHKNNFLLPQFTPLHKMSAILKTTQLSKMPCLIPLNAEVASIPVRRFIQPKHNKIPNGYRAEPKHRP